VQGDQAERKKMDKPQKTNSQKTYSVLMVGASSFMEDGNEWWIHGFPSVELATEFARRWVRSCVEEARRDLNAPLAWRQVGENALVPGYYDAGEDAKFFAAHPATAEEVDWQAVKRAAGLEKTQDEDQNAEKKTEERKDK
jgi:hypothetical protein